MLLRTLTGVLPLCALAIALSTEQSSAIASQPAERQTIFDGAHPVMDAQGVWLSSESGWILEIDRDRITRWQDTPAACYPSTSGPTFMGQIEYRYFTPLGADTARFEYLPDDGHAVFERLHALPDRCRADADTGPVAVFDAFVSVFERHYAFFDQRGVDWANQVDTARPRIHPEMNDADLFDVLSDLIAPLADSHTKLFANLDGEMRRAQFGLGDTLPRIEESLGETPWLIGIFQQLFTQVLDPGAQHIANDRIVIGTIEDRVGYLKFLTMGGFTSGHEAGSPEWARAEIDTLNTILDEALAGFDGMDAVILDLTNNRGGYDAVCRAITSRFTNESFTGYSVRTDDDGPIARQYDIAPSEGPRFTGPVYVLTSDVTVSCGEITTLILRQLPHVTQVGSTTRGAFSTPLAKPLPNGWYVELSNEIFADGDGEIHEGRGLIPDMEIAPFPADAPIEGHARLIDRVVESIPAPQD